MMKIIALSAFEYNGSTIEPGIFEGSEADLHSMEQWGAVRPATSTELENAERNTSGRQKATKK